MKLAVTWSTFSPERTFAFIPLTEKKQASSLFLAGLGLKGRWLVSTTSSAGAWWWDGVLPGSCLPWSA